MPPRSRRACVSVATAMALATASALGGCGGNGAVSLSTSSLNIGLDNIRGQKTGRLLASAPEPSSSTLTHAASGYGVIRDDKVEAYLKGIVTRLLEHWHGEAPPRVGVFVVSGDSLRAKATPFGDILLPIGAFDEIDNEDQLAALIGHELGHIVLRHHEDEKQAKQLADIANVAVGVVFGVSSIRNGGMRRYGNTREFYIKDPKAVSRDTLRAVGIHMSFVTLTQDILLTAFSREQEYAADLFGMRLAGTAGWDPRAILALIQRWHDAEEAEKQQHKDLMQAGSLGEGVTKALGMAAASLIASHPSAESRRDNVAKDLQKSFPGSDPKPPAEVDYKRIVEKSEFGRKREVWRSLRKAMQLMAKGSFVEANRLVRSVQKLPGAAHPDSRLVMSNAVRSSSAANADEEAFKLLATADTRQPASRTFYDVLASGYAWRRQIAEAEKTLDIGERYYGRTMLPSRLGLVRIQMTLAVGNSSQPPPQPLVQRSAQLMQACQQTGDPDLIEECTATSSGQSGEKQYEVCGGVISALAAMAPGGNNRCQQDGSRAFAPGPAQAPAATPGSALSQIMGGILGTPTR